MPRDFLRKIEWVDLPIEVRSPRDIRSAAVLRAAGMLEAIVPPEPFDERSVGTILKITPLGRAELRRDADGGRPLGKESLARPPVHLSLAPFSVFPLLPSASCSAHYRGGRKKNAGHQRSNGQQAFRRHVYSCLDVQRIGLQEKCRRLRGSGTKIASMFFQSHLLAGRTSIANHRRGAESSEQFGHCLHINSRQAGAALSLNGKVQKRDCRQQRQDCDEQPEFTSEAAAKVGARIVHYSTSLFASVLSRRVNFLSCEFSQRYNAGIASKWAMDTRRPNESSAKTTNGNAAVSTKARITLSVPDMPPPNHLIKPLPGPMFYCGWTMAPRSFQVDAYY
ncbi:hypothetical protein Q9L58_010879 [Maublancomyces gigas]|uniref:Uncharacterized protein n=1 Tax=Discina gigas TaxID=1032678 RepID=A0ABR3G2X3_9PEZI